jgi:hypothetical protein
VKLSDDADNIRYNARGGRVVIGYGGEKALRNRPAGSGAPAFVDSSGKHSGEIVVDAHPESLQLEKNGTRVFINVPNKKEVQVADVVNDGGPLANHRADDLLPHGVGRSAPTAVSWMPEPARLLVLDTVNGKTVASPAIVADTDDLFYDGARGRMLYRFSPFGSRLFTRGINLGSWLFWGEATQTRAISALATPD